MRDNTQATWSLPLLLAGIAVVVLGLLPSCGSAGSDGDDAWGPQDGVWIAEVSPPGDEGPGRVIIITLSGDTIRYDRMDSTVQLYGVRGTYEFADGVLTATWNEALIPHTVTTPDGESYAPLWVAIAFAQQVDIEGYEYRSSERATWQAIDADHVLAGPPGDKSVFVRLETSPRQDLVWVAGWYSGTEFGTRKSLLLGAECDFYYVSPYSVVGTVPTTARMTLYLWNGTWGSPSCAAAEFFCPQF